MPSHIEGIILSLRENASESSSSSSDEEWNSLLQKNGKRGRRRRRIINCENVMTRYSDDEFKTNFRLSRSTFNYLHVLIQEDLIRRAPGSPTIPSKHQLMIAIWKMSNKDSYKSVCDKFNVGRATAVRAVRRVSHALFVRASEFIQWPTGDRAIKVIKGFESASDFPKTIGAIDVTPIRISAPKINPINYINRKGYHSIQLQLVCDHKTLITHCYAEQPGSVDDQKILRLSEVLEYINEDDKFPEDSHIVGDTAYEINQHLLTPYEDNENLTEKQKKFNHHHSTARETIERCIGLLKGRMRSLLNCLPMTRVDLMAEYVVACCVIHNICILLGDVLPIITIPDSNHGNDGSLKHEDEQNAGIVKRNNIMNAFPR